MKQLATATIQSKVLNAKGKEVNTTEYALQIRGEEEAYSSEDVTFKPLAVYNKLLQWNKEGTQVLNETVFFQFIEEDTTIPDRNGGNACGRSFPVWEGKKVYTAAERDKANPNNAKWYSYLFGEVTFPGKAPVLVNYRITGNQCFDWGAVEKELKKQKIKLGEALLKLVAVGREGKEHLATTEYSILQTDLNNSNNGDAIKQIEDYVEEQNSKILDDYNDAIAKTA